MFPTDVLTRIGWEAALIEENTNGSGVIAGYLWTQKQTGQNIRYILQNNISVSQSINFFLNEMNFH